MCQCTQDILFYINWYSRVASVLCMFAVHSYRIPYTHIYRNDISHFAAQLRTRLFVGVFVCYCVPWHSLDPLSHNAYYGICGECIIIFLALA